MQLHEVRKPGRGAGRGRPGIELDRIASPDEGLVARARRGDRDAFESLVLRHQRPLVNHLFRLTGQREEAHDLAQDVFIKVFQSLDSFDPRFRFTTWLYRIASNCAIDHLRRRTPSTCPLSSSTDCEERQPDDPGAAPGPDPHSVLRLRELEARLEGAIASLPAEYRELILLRHRQHCRYDEIARITRLPMGTVKNRIFRAREILRKSLVDLLDGEAGS